MYIFVGTKDIKSIFVVLTFYGLISTIYTLELSSSIYKNDNGSSRISQLNELITNNFVATTHKIDMMPIKIASSYDQESDDYQQGVERVEHTKQEHHNVKNEVVSPLLNALKRTSRKTSQHEVSRKNHGDGQSKERYIKGDPLHGYFDAVMNIYAYKFWAVLQVFIGGLILYSAGQAIFYSKVNPSEGEIYLRRKRFVVDDSNSSQWPFNSHWLQTASYGFQFILDAIEQLPLETNEK